MVDHETGTKTLMTIEDKIEMENIELDFPEEEDDSQYSQGHNEFEEHARYIEEMGEDVSAGVGA